MRALLELFAQARERGLEVEVRPGAPDYLADAARSPAPPPPLGESRAPGAADTGDTREAAGRLVVAGAVEPLAQGDWLALDLPGGADSLAARA
ncbi:MAG: hypothetical protein LBL01_01800, partial [Bifidobacteriaceae bacterium]|nr:hypothetical protein [Bifidobacteriaceae bacterium]